MSILLKNSALLLLLVLNYVDGQAQLLLVQAMWRHGGRNPISACPTDPNQSSSWPRGFGQLTVTGMQQQFYLGRRLWNVYQTQRNFLSPSYVQGDVYIRSTDVDRALMSADSNLLGFFSKAAKAGTDYPQMANWTSTQYIPLAIHDGGNVANDEFANPDAPCPRQTALQALWPNTPEYQQVMAQYGQLLSQIPTWCGKSVTLFNNDFFYLYDTLFLEQQNNRTLPSWANSSVMYDLAALRNIVLGWQLGLTLAPYNGVDFKTEAATMRGGLALQTMVNNMKGRIACLQAGGTGSACTSQLAQKYYAYSAHDVTLSALLIALGLDHTNFYSFNGNGPYYPGLSDTIILELYGSSASNYADAYVRVFYWAYPVGSGDLPGGPIELTGRIPGCTSTSCPLSALQINQPLPSRATYCANTTLI